MTRRGWTLFGAMCVIWGIPYLLIKVAVADVSPPTLVFLRTATGALLLIPIAVTRGQLAPLRPRWRMLLLYTAIEIATPWLLLSDAETKLSSSLSGLLLAAVPLIGAVIAATIGEERLDARRLLGLFAGIGGVAMLLGFDVNGGDLRAVGGLAKVEFVLEIPFVRLRSLDGSPTMVAAFTTDIPALSNWGEPLLVGPGSIHVAHTEGEYVDKKQLLEAVELYCTIAKRLLQ